MFRYRLVDFSRGVAAILIAILHWNVFMIDADWGSYAAGGLMPPLANILGPIYTHAEFGVQYFWILSGFVFAHVYGRDQVGFGEYASRRLARLYPLHLMTLLLVAVLQIIVVALIGTTLFYGSADVYHFVLNLFFIPSLGFEDTLSFNGPIWSVAVELPIYILFWLYARSLPGNAVSALLVAAMFFMLQPVIGFSKIDLCGMLFFIGVAIFYLCRNIPALPLAYLSVLAWIIGVAAALMVPAVAGTTTLMLIIGFGPLLAILSAFDRLAKDNGALIDHGASFGDLSYSMYLLHVPLLLVIAIAMIIFDIDRALLDAALWPMLVYIVALIGLSRLSLIWFEQPARTLLRKVLRSRIRNPAT